MNDPLELLKVIFDRIDTVRDYWNLYIAVSVGLLGIILSSEKLASHLGVRALFALGFVIFAISNYEAIFGNESSKGRVN